MHYRAEYKFLKLLLVVAFLLSALIPAGFMPSSDTSKVSIEICSGADIVTVYLDQDNSDKHQSDAHQTCPYAILSSPDNDFLTSDFQTPDHYAIKANKNSIYINTVIYAADFNLIQSRAPPIIL